VGVDMAKTKKSSNTYKVGRDATTGRFIPVKAAKRRKKTAVVETIRKRDRGYSVHSEPVHTTKAKSGAEIIRGLDIKKSDVRAAKEIVKKKQSEKIASTRKR
jgi:hypothetical protein